MRWGEGNGGWKNLFNPKSPDHPSARRAQSAANPVRSRPSGRQAFGDRAPGVRSPGCGLSGVSQTLLAQGPRFVWSDPLDRHRRRQRPTTRRMVRQPHQGSRPQGFARRLRSPDPGTHPHPRDALVAEPFSPRLLLQSTDGLLPRRSRPIGPTGRRQTLLRRRSHPRSRPGNPPRRLPLRHPRSPAYCGGFISRICSF